MNVFDSGDLELPFGNPEKLEISALAEHFDDAKCLCMIGSKHPGHLGAVRAVADKISRFISFTSTSCRSEGPSP